MQNENPWYIETAELAEMLFPEAGEIWLASRTPYISPKTFILEMVRRGERGGL